VFAAIEELELVEAFRGVSDESARWECRVDPLDVGGQAPNERR
jgi:hypothetical protein